MHIFKSVAPVLSGHPLRYALVTSLFSFALLGGPWALAGSSALQGAPMRVQQAEVEDLAVCYARGTDALGAAVNAVPTGDDLDSQINLSEPQFAKALRLYRRCFSKGFSFTLEVDGEFVLTVPDPDARSKSTDAALQWANFVNNAFRGPGYKDTQHHMGSISSQVRGRRARMTSYLIATHIYGPTSANTGIFYVTGTYSDRLVRQRGRWQIAQRTLNITSQTDIPGL